MAALHNSTDDTAIVTYGLGPTREEMLPGAEICVPTGTLVRVRLANGGIIVIRWYYIRNRSDSGRTASFSPIWFVKYYITRNPSYDLGGPGDGSTSRICHIVAASITNSDTGEYVLDDIGPNMWSALTHETDQPLALSMNTLFMIITVTGRSMDHAFHTSYTIVMNDDGTYRHDELYTYATHGLVLTSTMYEGHTFTLTSNVSRQWRIYTLAS